MKRKMWTEYERKQMKRLFPEEYTQYVADYLKRSYSSIVSQATSMGLSKSAAFREMEVVKQKQRLEETGSQYRYNKGDEPKNKGLKQSEWMTKQGISNSKKTRFGAGQMPFNSIPEGVEVLRKQRCAKEYIMLKPPGHRKLMLKHKWLWETANGKVPKGYNIVFKDRNQMNCILENLECLSNSELMLRNTIHRYPQELIRVIKMNAKLKKLIHEKQN